MAAEAPSPGEASSIVAPDTAESHSPNRALLLVVVSIFSVQFGAAAAKHLFGTVPPVSMTWLRLLFATAMLWLIARPRLRGRTVAEWRLALLYALGMVGMNWAIYESFSRIPLGIAVTLEFLGPLTVAVLGSRRVLDLVWVGLAGAGVALLGLGGTIDNVVGVLFALLAGTCWGLYIIMGARIGSSWAGLSVITFACTLGAIVFAVPAVVAGGARLLDPTVLGIGALVALMSTVVPYSLELVALRTLPPRLFGILMSLEPAAAALAALVLLRELLGVTDWLAIGCVVAASWGATWSARTAAARAHARAQAGTDSDPTGSGPASS